MNTHILIPINKIEKRIIEFQDTIVELTEMKINTKYQENCLGELQRTLAFGKQVSLDEKAIEEKVKQYADTGANGWEQNGYRQALKNLL